MQSQIAMHDATTWTGSKTGIIESERMFNSKGHCIMQIVWWSELDSDFGRLGLASTERGLAAILLP
ncbi:MAG: hypothetical protein ACOC9Y_10935, partial [Chloroflexota bacterium]